MDNKHYPVIIEGLRAFGGLSDAYMRSANIISEAKIISDGIILKVTHPKTSAGFMSWEILLWDDMIKSDNLEQTVIDLFGKHIRIVLDKAGLPMPMIRPYRVRSS
jgi:hypothetical protein